METRSRSNVWKEHTHNKGQKYGIELTFLFKLLGLCASYDPVWMILMTFMTYKGVLIWRRLLTAAWCQWWNGATGFAIPDSVFDLLPVSAFDKPWSATDDAAVALPIFFKHFFRRYMSMLITVHVVRSHCHKYFSLIHKWHIQFLYFVQVSVSGLVQFLFN